MLSIEKLEELTPHELCSLVNDMIFWNRYNSKYLDRIIRCGLDLNFVIYEYNNCRVFHKLILEQMFDFAIHFIEAGVDIECTDTLGATALHYCCSNSKIHTDLLISAGADVNAKDISGWTPLHWAAHNVNIQMIKLLLANSADKYIMDNAGKTPWDWSSQYVREMVPELGT